MGLSKNFLDNPMGKDNYFSQLQLFSLWKKPENRWNGGPMPAILSVFGSFLLHWAVQKEDFLDSPFIILDSIHLEGSLSPDRSFNVQELHNEIVSLGSLPNER